MAEGSENRLELFIALITDIKGGELTKEELGQVTDAFSALGHDGSKALGDLAEHTRSADSNFRGAMHTAEGLGQVFASGTMSPSALARAGMGLTQLAEGLGATIAGPLALAVAALAAGVGIALHFIEQEAQQAEKALDAVIKKIHEARTAAEGLEDLTGAGELPTRKELGKDITAQEQAVAATRVEVDKLNEKISAMAMRTTGPYFMPLGAAALEKWKEGQLGALREQLSVAQADLASAQQALTTAKATTPREDAEFSKRALDDFIDQKRKELEVSKQHLHDKNHDEQASYAEQLSILGTMKAAQEQAANEFAQHGALRLADTERRNAVRTQEDINRVILESKQAAGKAVADFQEKSLKDAIDAQKAIEDDQLRPVPERIAAAKARRRLEEGGKSPDERALIETQLRNEILRLNEQQDRKDAASDAARDRDARTAQKAALDTTLKNLEQITGHLWKISDGHLEDTGELLGHVKQLQGKYEDLHSQIRTLRGRGGAS